MDDNRCCQDAVEVAFMWAHARTPFWVPCQHCRSRNVDADGCSRTPDGEVCDVCGGSGWQECRTIHQCPWAIDELTIVYANLHVVWAKG